MKVLFPYSLYSFQRPSFRFTPCYFEKQPQTTAALAGAVVVGCSGVGAADSASCSGESVVCGGGGCGDWTDQGLWFSALSARLSPLMLSTLSAPSTAEFLRSLSVLDLLAIAFLIFLTCLYIVHLIAQFYGKSWLHHVRDDVKGPGVSIIKPVVGLNENLRENLETFFNLNYHKFELLFCFQDENDEAIPLVRELIKEYPTIDSTVFIGGEEVGHNPKINNMMPAYRAAKYPLFFISDSGIWLQRLGVQDMVNSMGQGVALVTQTPYCKDRPEDGAQLEQVYFGTAHARIYLAGNFLGVVCSTGMSSLVRKSALEECGGLQAFGAYLAEDYFMGVELMRRGWKLRIGRLPAMQNTAGVTVGGFRSRIRRWMKLRFAMLPSTIILEPLQDCFLSGVLAALSLCRLIGPWGSLLLPLHLLFWFFMDYSLIRTIQKGDMPYGIGRFFRIWMNREGYALMGNLTALWDQKIEWRTGSFRLAWGGRIVHADKGKGS